ncbi:MAG: hypothetical protein H0T17_03690, partial [Propionibacteriales bacterium]|nr:hypothetical protein [Propionibacteriales bacterium]
DVSEPPAVKRVLLCSGRLTWDLLAERQRREPDSTQTAILRLEQLYPRPADELKAELAKYPNAEKVRWVQDEPANMGPWPHMKLNLEPEIGVVLERVSRAESAAPSVGQVAVHRDELAALLDAAFA